MNVKKHETYFKKYEIQSRIGKFLKNRKPGV